MSGRSTATASGLQAAERVMAEHLAALSDRSYELRCLHRGTIQLFLAYCRKVRPQPADRLLLNRQQLVQWLIQVCTGVAVAYARQRIYVLARYSRALVRAGILETDLVAEFRAEHGQSGWQPLIAAFRADDPDTALSALRLASIGPAPGPLAALIYPYAELRRSLGLKGETTRSTLLDLDRFAQAQGITAPGEISSALIEQWMKPMDVIPAVRIRKARCVKRFFDHLRTLRVVAINPVPASLLATRKQRSTCIKPFIFTTAQIAAILCAAGKLPDSKRFAHRAQTCVTMLTLLCALGLRHGEVRRLRLRDVDLARCTLFIDQTKFHKSRYVPFGPKVGRRLQQFLTLRRTVLSPVGEDDLLFMTPSRVPLAYESLYKAFDEILADLGIAGGTGQRAPRIHDLRHSFAVHRLLRWYREGVDVQSRLLSLSVFMGHVNIHSTQVYLTVTGDLLREANDRFQRHVATVIDREVRLVTDSTLLAPHVRSFFEDHLACQRNMSPNTIRSYRDALKLVLRFTVAHLGKPVTRLLVTDLHEPLVIEFLSDLERTRGNSIQTRNHRLGVLQSLYEYIASRDPVLLEHCHRIATIPHKRGAAVPEVRYLEKEQVAAVLDAVDRGAELGRRDHALLLFLYNTGARVQEVADTRVSWLHLVPPHKVELLGKGRKWRTCPLWDNTVQRLQELIQTRPHPTNGEDYVFVNRQGGRLTRSGIADILERAVARAAKTTPGLQGCRVTPHTFRHTTAMHLLQSGVEVNVIRSWLGHVSISTTNRYIEIDLAMKRKALETCQVGHDQPAAGRWRSDPDILSWLESL